MGIDSNFINSEYDTTMIIYIYTSNFNSIIEKYANLESIYACWSQRNRIYDPSQPSKLTVK